MHDDDSDDEEELTEDDVVSKVLKFIREECECGAEDIPREAVIPVYGMWAYKARMLAREPTKASRKKKIVNILCKMYNQPVGQGENPKKILKKRSSLELSQDLEKLSKIDKVEERYGLYNFYSFILFYFILFLFLFFLFSRVDHILSIEQVSLLKRLGMPRHLSATLFLFLFILNALQ